MLIITRRLASRLRSVFRQALNLTSRSMRHPVYLEGGPHGLHIRCCRKDQAAVQYQLDGQHPAETFAVPFELLSDVEGRKDESVKLELQQNRVLAQWRDGSVPQLVAHDVLDSEPDNWPPPAESLEENPPRLLKALADAYQATDPESSRYALGCIQLQGKSGKIAATDGRQILLQSDFTFPWEDDVLVPGSKIFGQLPSDQPVFIGRSEKWFVLQTGPWTVWLQLKEGRFPRVEDLVRRCREATASFHISKSDRTFLTQNLRRLPSHNEQTDPVTVDLNGQVAIRARQEVGPVTELILSDSPCTGEPIRLNTNRFFLARAVQLGFKDVYVFEPNSPAQCEDEHRQYVWALLEPKLTIAPSPDAVRITSSSDSASIPSQPRRTRTPMSKTPNESTTERRTSNGESRSAETDSSANAIEQATALRDTLREATAQAGELIRTLKREKKQAKLVKSTLDSLRQLQDVTG